MPSIGQGFSRLSAILTTLSTRSAIACRRMLLRLTLGMRYILEASGYATSRPSHTVPPEPPSSRASCQPIAGR
ncbi:uncharacterized protein K452DRAFT_32035 [Aplosporella prunicola CBS 121167]|uniref:Uncharacterized protein n=1 Tax=Aplosporella prunicola CBS 121167 TaxID=1176127 RepID=A0A6A6BDU4_9PEZI|nr:uncharacterized protein K452DRAFT_32035 [Aplosporella prunicola CBS 121167]KAF2141678.1 hypothetical protein K452DRAFT_32035 [Aplosporella prunicola CBS 121167]